MTAPVSAAEWEAQRRAATEAMPAVIEAVGLPAVLLPYQAEALRLCEDPATRVLVIEKSRRIGLTWALAAYAVLRAGREKAAGGTDFLYVSYSHDMTREFVDACGMWARAFSVAAAASEEFLFADGDATGDRSIKAFRVAFASGFEVIALSSAPRSLRGKQGVVLIDEAAFVDDLPALLKSALAYLIWGGQVIVCSTHLGADNPFNELVQDVLAGRKAYAHLRIDLDQALEQGLYVRRCLVKEEPWTPEGEARFRTDIIADYGEGAEEELFCVPSASSGAWLPGPLIEARMTAGTPVLRLELPPDFLQRTALDRAVLMAPFLHDLADALKGLDLAPHYAFGFDFARVADLSVGVLLSIEKRLERRQRLVIEMRGVPGDEQKMAVATILSTVRTRLVGAAFDATGMGWTVAEDMGRKYGLRAREDEAGLVWAIKFTEDWYRLHMPPLKAAFEDGLIAIAADAEHLSDLRVVKVVRGVPRVPATREGERGRRRHGDYAVALALAHFASRLRWAEYGYRPAVRSQAGNVGPGRMRDAPDDEDASGDGGGRAWWTGPLGAGLRGGIR